MNYIVIFIIGAVLGILFYIYIRKILIDSKLFLRRRKEYLVTFTLMCFYHPIDTNKKGEFAKTKPITIKVSAYDDNEAEDIARIMAEDNIKVEIESIILKNEQDNTTSK